MRNYDVHRKREVVKQQKGKENAVIHVWVFPKLNSQSRPSKAFFVLSGCGSRDRKSNSNKLAARIDCNEKQNS